MTDRTPRGLPVGHGNSKLRRKQLEIMSLELGMEQRRVEIAEKEEELERMEAQKTRLADELKVMEEQIVSDT